MTEMSILGSLFVNWSLQVHSSENKKDESDFIVLYCLLSKYAWAEVKVIVDNLKKLLLVEI